ncbi:hypothetical protein Godav_021414 [Gossypium davidsonii]|uniref:Uncharacterized protein n=1 Tax=Gossypium davidsonii TaxID=34287 RepID=A0A7J8R656_GOSDV|nr:hypothetical protein [Gossypium davidsonii]
MRKINRKVTEIQNKGLGEHRLSTKKLSGVKDLFEKPSKLRKRRTIYDIYKSINASYYGYKDEEDGVLARVEGPTETKMRAEAEEEEDVVEEEKREREEKERKDKEREFVVHVPLPGENDIERMIVERKKMKLLSKYASEGLLEE